MRGGKSLFAIFLATLAVQILPAVRDWFVQTFLDNIAESPDGFYGFGARALNALAPFQQLMLGVSVGIMIALTIGYWDRIQPRIKRAYYWTPAILRLALRARPGKRRLVQ